MREPIDMVCAGEGFDGIPVYAPPAEVARMQAIRAVVELVVTHRQSILHGLALMGLGALSIYMVTPERKPAPRRRRRKVA
jgi:hypothetical protein